MKLHFLSSLFAILLFGAVLFQVQISNISIYLLVLWIVCCLIDYRQELPIILSQRKYKCLLLFLLFYFISTSIALSPYLSLTRVLYQMTVFAPVLMYDLLEHSERKTKIFILIPSFVLYVSYAIFLNTLIAFYGADLGLKSSISHVGEDNYIANAFFYIYSLPLILSALILVIKYLYVNKKNKWLILVFGAAVAFFAQLIFRSLYMTATILMVISVLSSLVYNLKNNKWIVRSAVILVSFLIAFVAYYGIISQRLSEFGSTQFDQRVTEVFDILTGNSHQAQDFNSRQDLSTVSLSTFFENPIFGVNHNVAGRVDDTIVGNHAEWLDLLAEYGLFAILIFIIIIDSLKKIRKIPFIMVACAIYVFTGFLNPMLHLINNYTLFVFIPILLDVLTNTKKDSTY